MRTRVITTGLVVLSCVPVMVGCGGSSVTTAELEAGIKTDYGTQLRQEAASNGVTDSVRVDDLSCVKRGDDAARCFATVSGGVSGRVPIEVTIDGAEYLWETDGDSFAALRPADGAQPEALEDEPQPE